MEVIEEKLPQIAFQSGLLDTLLESERLNFESFLVFELDWGFEAADYSLKEL